MVQLAWCIKGDHTPNRVTGGKATLNYKSDFGFEQFFLSIALTGKLIHVPRRKGEEGVLGSPPHHGVGEEVVLSFWATSGLWLPQDLRDMQRKVAPLSLSVHREGLMESEETVTLDEVRRGGRCAAEFENLVVLYCDIVM
uniref:Uncharacterized protein n=1 Tax=Parascaris equorum TaxID=6256 RepID=A0A914RFF1_PAREQ